MGVNSKIMSRNTYTTSTLRNQVFAPSFYSEYHGHKIYDLQKLHQVVQQNRADQGVGTNFIYLIGDSTLDNKYWLRHLPGGKVTPPNGLQHAFYPDGDVAIADVAHFVNKSIENSSTNTSQEPSLSPYVCINASIEESTLIERENGYLFPQDKFVRDQLTENDVVVCSVGGNDIALKPNFKTIVSMLTALVTSHFKETPFGLGHFYELFGGKTAQFLTNLCSKKKPKLVVVCMLYHLDCDAEAQSWASTTLGLMRYNSKPAILKHIIESVYENGTKTVQVDGTKVVYLPLFKVLDGNDTSDYVERVEPSVVGGEKMGKEIWRVICENVNK